LARPPVRRGRPAADAKPEHKDPSAGSRRGDYRPVGPGEPKEPRRFEGLVSVRGEFARRDLRGPVVRLGPRIVPGRGGVIEETVRAIRSGFAKPIRIKVAGRGVD